MEMRILGLILTQQNSIERISRYWLKARTNNIKNIQEPIRMKVKKIKIFLRRDLASLVQEQPISRRLLMMQALLTK